MIHSILLSLVVSTALPVCSVYQSYQNDLKSVETLYEFVYKFEAGEYNSTDYEPLFKIYQEMNEYENKYDKLAKETADIKQRRFIQRMSHFFNDSKWGAYYGIKYVTSGNDGYKKAFIDNVEEIKKDFTYINEVSKIFNCRKR